MGKEFHCTMEELLSFQRVSYAYDSEHDSLMDFSVTIHRGEKIAVLGNNGAGKTTFFLLANGVLKPRSGSITFCGEAISRSAKSLNRLRQGVALVFQDPDTQLIAGTVEEEISFGPMNLDLPESEVKDRVEQAARCFHLESFLSRPPQYLSGGEKKRVTLADAIAMKPELLLLDEPASSLDPANSMLLEENLAVLSQGGLTLAIATHDVDFAWRWADRILAFHGGKLAADGTPEEIFQDEALLRKCGLRQPTLCQVGKLLRLPVLPKTMGELESMI